jgi:adenylate cyclase
MNATRKLAAILAADVAGYSRLVGLDEEGAIARLQALRRELIDPTITQYHGRIFKTTGDGKRHTLSRDSAVDWLRVEATIRGFDGRSVV